MAQDKGTKMSATDQMAKEGAEPANTNIDTLCIDTIRTLAMDAVQKANSGHPGTPMALAPVAYTIWQNVLRYDPADPTWPGRDRFVLSPSATPRCCSTPASTSPASNASTRTPSPPTNPPSPSTTSSSSASSAPSPPAIRNTASPPASRPPPARSARDWPTPSAWPSPSATSPSRYNKPGFPLYDFRIYAVCGDGCMMEGVSNEAASVAGHLKLSNLVYIYDSNHITIEGSTNLAFSEDVGARYHGLGWNVIHLDDANDTVGLLAALQEAEMVSDKPTPDHRPLHHRLRRPQEGRHPRSPWRTAGRRGDQGHQALLRLARGLLLPRPRRRPRTFRRHHRRPRRQAASRLERDAREIPRRIPGSREGTRPDRAPPPPRRLGRRHPRLPRRRQGPRLPRFLAESPQRHRQARPLADRRRRRPRPLHQIQPHLRRRRQLPARHLRRPQHAFRHPRTRHGQHLQRHGAHRPALLRLRLPHLHATT